MKNLLVLALLPLIMSASCTTHTVTTQQTSVDPNSGQQVTTTTTQTDDYSNGNYSVYTGPNGQQYAVCTIDGAQRYIPYNTFQTYMNNGGYPAIYDYYYSNHAAFGLYSAALTWHVMNNMGGSYNGYYTRYHVRPRVYTAHYYHAPATRSTIVQRPVVSSNSVRPTTPSRASLSAPTSSQRSFQVRNPSTPVRSGGFGSGTVGSSTRSSYTPPTSSRSSGFGNGSRSSFGSSSRSGRR